MTGTAALQNEIQSHINLWLDFTSQQIHSYVADHISSLNEGPKPFLFKNQHNLCFLWRMNIFYSRLHPTYYILIRKYVQDRKIIQILFMYRLTDHTQSRRQFCDYGTLSQIFEYYYFQRYFLISPVKHFAGKGVLEIFLILIRLECCPLKIQKALLQETL